ncbi:hypothetical protein KXS11_17035 [Plantibacter flavus]|uniref:DUF7882 family protein n=1 Tax=Plantibacter flavus TaxID=150123 RepID=UPI003F1495A5
MGSILYGSAQEPITLDDETLAYVKTIAVMKLRRNESFLLSWQPAGSGRASVWLHPAISLQFRFEHPELPQLDRDRLERLMQQTNQTGDLHVPSEEPIG